MAGKNFSGKQMSEAFINIICGRALLKPTLPHLWKHLKYMKKT